MADVILPCHLYPCPYRSYPYQNVDEPLHRPLAEHARSLGLSETVYRLMELKQLDVHLKKYHHQHRNAQCRVKLSEKQDNRSPKIPTQSSPSFFESYFGAQEMLMMRVGNVDRLYWYDGVELGGNIIFVWR